MASSSAVLNEELQCSICLDVFTDPVTTPCGHNFCRTCLNQCWKKQSTCFCPFCKEKYRGKPVLKVNITLREVVQHFKKRLSQGDSKVFCDFCEDRKRKAVKSCLTCPSSYCENHLEPHYRVPRLKKHKLIRAVENLEDYICRKHDRPLEIFCRDDQMCLCLSCTEGEHGTHDTVPLELESQQKKDQFVKAKADVHQMIQDRMKKIQEIQHSVELRKSNTGKEKLASVKVFTGLIRCSQRCQTELLNMMDEQQKAAEKLAEGLIKDLQKEITELRKRNTELEEHINSEDHLQLIQINTSTLNSVNTKNWSEVGIESEVNVLPLHRALKQLKKSHEAILENLSRTGLDCVQKYAVDVTLDPNTAHPFLILSKDRKQVRLGDIKNAPEHYRRFDQTCVLAKEGLSSGRFYYEVAVKGKSKCLLGVARELFDRNGDVDLDPKNGLWVILINDNQYAVCDNPWVVFPQEIIPKKLGVFVDYEEGLVSFYNVESRSHIYSFTGQTFNEKLYPYLNLCLNEVGKNSNSLIFTTVTPN